ncbi:MAG: histidine--tRNA ligase [Candidatus Bathyarchaeia archaeon]
MPGRFALPRGMHDIYPEEMEERLWLYDKILQVMRKYGFKLVEPTPIEALETLEAKSGPAIRDEIYHFKDKSGRDLGLRFDLTVGMTRMVAGRSDLPEPLKICAISGMWRYDEPQFARYRYFHQWDAEIYGSEHPLADAEIIALSMDVLDSVGLANHELLISSRPIVEGYIESQGVKDRNIRLEILRAIDKMRGTTQPGLVEKLRPLTLSTDIVESIASFVSLRGAPDKILNELSYLKCESPSFKSGLETLSKLIEYLGWYGKLDKCFLDMSIVRGIDYYDGIVFEAYDKGGEEVGAILGGGRYDCLGRIYGKRMLPATGVAGGIERMLISLRREKLIPGDVSRNPKVFVAAVNEEVRGEAVALASKIRGGGIACEIDLKNRSLRRQLEYAEAIKALYTVIVGPEELSRGKVKIRDMERRVEEELTISSLVEYLKGKITERR